MTPTQDRSKLGLRIPGACVLGLLLLLTVGPGARSASTPSLSAAERSALLNRFQPVTYFHHLEAWPPARVEPYLVASDLEERRQSKQDWKRSQLTELPTSRGSCIPDRENAFCYRLNVRSCALAGGSRCYQRRLSGLRSWSRTTVYGTVVEARQGAAPLPAEISSPPRYLLQYYYFYGFDDWQRTVGKYRFAQTHEGDWEQVTIGLSGDDPPSPVFAAFSSHCGGTWSPWPSEDVSKDTSRGVSLVPNTQHPKVYVAFGSHANYFSARPRAMRFLRCLWKPARENDRLIMIKDHIEREHGIDDVMEEGRALGPQGAGRVQTRLVILSSTLPSWGRFKGYWSEGNVVLVRRRAAFGIWTPPATIHLTNAPGPPNLFQNDVSAIFGSKYWRRD
jgi:hypothetical protein